MSDIGEFAQRLPNRMANTGFVGLVHNLIGEMLCSVKVSLPEGYEAEPDPTPRRSLSIIDLYEQLGTVVKALLCFRGVLFDVRRIPRTRKGATEPVQRFNLTRNRALGPIDRDGRAKPCHGSVP
jgi:hypothetical protein